MKKGFLVALAAIIFLPLLIGELAAASMLNNDWKLQYTKHWYALVEHPQKTYSIRREAVVANLAGASNGCFYGVAEVRSGSLSRDEVLAFYSSYIKATQSLRSLILFNVYFLEDELPVSFDALFNKFPAFRTMPTTSSETIYILTAVEGPYPAGFDVRCH